MPGPGGGSHGGGGHGGGGFGGGSHGGGFGGSHGGGFGGPRGGFGGPHGGMHGGFHGPHMGGFGGPHMGGFGWHRRPPRHYGGGGCLGGLLSMIFVPIFLIVFVVMFMFGSCSANKTSTTEHHAEYDIVDYDEETFQDFADEMYSDEFGESTAYEDNLLIVVLTTEDCDEYYYIAWVGDHIVTDINYLFGNEETEFGQAMEDSINTANYKYSLDSNLASVMETMKKEITDLGLNSSFKCDEEHAQVQSHLTNKTDLDLTEDTVNTALEDFTETTGIPVVVVVEDAEDVF